MENSELVFAFAQNDTLFPASEEQRFFYLNSRLPVDSTSMAGHVAVTGRSVNIADAHALAPSLPFAFNGGFDRATGYRTRSVLTLPLCDREGQMLGVLQLINCQQGGQVVPFSQAMQEQVEALAQTAIIPMQQILAFTNNELRRQLSFYESLFNALPNPVFAQNDKANFVNKAYERFFGMEGNAPAADAPAGAGHDEHYETEYATHDGPRNALYWSRAIALPTGEKAFVGQVVDISRLKRLENELAAKVAELEAERQRLDRQLNLVEYDAFVEGLATLTRAERQVFDLYAAGHTAEELPGLLHILVNTLKTHNRNIYSKLNVSSYKELMVFVRMMDARGGR